MSKRNNNIFTQINQPNNENQNNNGGGGYDGGSGEGGGYFENNFLLKLICICFIFILIILFIGIFLYIALTHIMQDNHTNQLLMNHILVDNKKVLEFTSKTTNDDIDSYYFEFKSSNELGEEELFLLNFDHDVRLNKIPTHDICCVSRDSKNKCSTDFSEKDDIYFYGYMTQNENGEIMTRFWFNDVIYSQVDCWLKCEVINI